MTDKKYLYPLKFDTIFKEKIWGGTKIRIVEKPGKYLEWKAISQR